MSVLPTGWMLVNGFGIRQMTTDSSQIAANVSVGEDKLQDENGLPDYIAAQAKLIGAALKDPKLAVLSHSHFPTQSSRFCSWCGTRPTAYRICYMYKPM